MSDETKNADTKTHAEIDKLTTSDLLVAIMNRISHDISDEALGKVLALLDEIALDQKKKG
ncbi:MAG TPA: hypothetical protein VLM38_22200 [Blastocatellia bacterium]|nr:hypothetical protein [Blastocatellia bacterium]